MKSNSNKLPYVNWPKLPVAMTRAFAVMGGEKVTDEEGKEMELPPTHLWDDNDLIECWKNAPYDLPAQNLVPMIFNHGYAGQAHSYSGLFREFASHGYVVISLEACDGSATYTQKQDGTEIFTKYDAEFKDVGMHSGMAEQRGKEVNMLIDDLHNGFLSKDCGFTLDLDKLIVNGQSFGGAATIYATVQDEAANKRIKASLQIDAWMYPTSDKDYSSFNIACTPMQRIYSEFAWSVSIPPEWDHDKYQDGFDQACIKAGNSNFERLKTLDHGHVDQIDTGVFLPMELRMGGSVGNIGYGIGHQARKYKLYAFLQMNWLKSQGLLSNLANQAVIDAKLAEPDSKAEVVKVNLTQ